MSLRAENPRRVRLSPWAPPPSPAARLMPGHVAQGVAQVEDRLLADDPLRDHRDGLRRVLERARAACSCPTARACSPTAAALARRRRAARRPPCFVAGGFWAKAPDEARTRPMPTVEATRRSLIRRVADRRIERRSRRMLWPPGRDSGIGLAGHGRRPWLAGWSSLHSDSSASRWGRRTRVGRILAGGEAAPDAPRAQATARQGNTRADQEHAARRGETGDRLTDHAADLAGVQDAHERAQLAPEVGAREGLPAHRPGPWRRRA